MLDKNFAGFEKRKVSASWRRQSMEMTIEEADQMLNCSLNMYAGIREVNV